MPKRARDMKPNEARTLLDVAKAFGKHRQTIYQWRPKGMPGKNQRGYYDLEAIAKWASDRGYESGRSIQLKKEVSELQTIGVSDSYKELVRRYVLDRKDILALGQIKRIRVAERLLQVLLDKPLEELMRSKLGDIANILKALDLGVGIHYDKERLERGESTENIGIVIAALKEVRQKRAERGYISPADTAV